MDTPTIFSTWMRVNLKDAFSGLITQDIDFIIDQGTGHFFIAEEKICKNARTGPAQAVIYKMLNDLLKTDNQFRGCFKLTLHGQYVFVNETNSYNIPTFLSFNFTNALENKTLWFENVIRNSFNYLWDGKGEPPRKKTQKERMFLRPSNIKPLLDDSNIYYEDINWIFVNYVTGFYALFTEGKSKPGPLLERILNTFETNREGELGIKNPKSLCIYKYLGHFNIEYIVENDEDISSFIINGKKVDLNTAINLLNLTSRDIETFLNY